MRLFSKKMHPFKAAIADKKVEDRELETAFRRFSRALVTAVGFDEADLNTAVSESMLFEAGDYLIEARSVCCSDGWHNCLIVVPREVGSRVGYRHNDSPLPSGWEACYKGTRTMVLPPPEVRDQIIQNVIEMGR